MHRQKNASCLDWTRVNWALWRSLRSDLGLKWHGGTERVDAQPPPPPPSGLPQHQVDHYNASFKHGPQHTMCHFIQYCLLLPCCRACHRTQILETGLTCQMMTQVSQSWDWATAWIGLQASHLRTPRTCGLNPCCSCALTGTDIMALDEADSEEGQEGRSRWERLQVGALRSCGKVPPLS